MTSESRETAFLPNITPQMPYTDGVLRGRYGPYLADSRLIDAANVALSLEMPLLLTGEPGCGKTDFAYVVARALASRPEHVLPLECQIRSDVHARDLLYHYDALLRFTDGHHGDEHDRRRARDARNYVELRPLGVALTSAVRRVVLIDEIDKAPRDLPNDLLRELERGTFEIPEIRDATSAESTVPDPHTGVPLTRVMHRPHDAPKPMVPGGSTRRTRRRDDRGMAGAGIFCRACCTAASVARR